MQLPQIYSDDKDFQLLQTKWRSILNPIIAIPLLSGLQLNNIALASGDNIINTTLGRRYQGWIITSMKSAYAEVYEVASSNPVINLTLNANGPTTVDLWVF